MRNGMALLAGCLDFVIRDRDRDRGDTQNRKKLLI